ncbi:hypothetical protein BDV96DRAFT_598121 [Lophiotrema nucula]|uniref:Uncharacterized protein n=1 Tax=Lophiotrema nucula TaxID=690887 RepID=A0A6A5ZD98_9PLEO|nr:hypothetical protein BDV96DRAFT_598121 [Lophiotrema nucula]
MGVSTPKRPAQGLPSTPHSGASQQSVMDCSSNAEDFTIVEIHTAKCAICDKRNMAKMRRCPGCTYQVCQPCFEAQGDTPLKHGNSMDLLSSLPATPKRHVPWNGKGTTSGETGAAATPGMKTPLSIPSSTPSSTLKKLGIAVKEGGEEGTEERTPVKARSSERKRKPVKVIPSDTEDDGEDEDFVPGGESRTPSPSPSKRRKRVAADDIATPTSQRTPRGSNNNTNTTTLARQPLAMPDFSSKRGMRLLTPQPSEGGEASGGDVFGGGPEIAGGSNNTTPARGTLSAQELLDRVRAQVGITEPPIEPLLRERPLENPVIQIPSNVARNFKPRLKSPDIQQNIQTKVRGKLEAKQAEASSVKSPSKSPSVEAPTSSQTVRQLVLAEASKLYQNIAIDEDQKNAIESSMREAARKLIVKYKADAPPFFSEHMTFGLDMLVAQLGGRQKEELIHAIWENGRRVVNEFKEELSAHTPKSKSDNELPPVGMYHVSPSRPMPLASPPMTAAAPPSVQRLSTDLNSGNSGNGHGDATAGSEEHRSSTERAQH